MQAPRTCCIIHLVNRSQMTSTSNVYAKLNQARVRLQGTELKKTGRNKFAGYNYFELGDFLPTVQAIFAELGLCGIVSYSDKEAVLRIYDCANPADMIGISSPMSSASLKGAHDIQNLGAVQTYLRRYLWVTAMEIVEHDELDATLGAAKGAASEPEAARPEVKPTPAPAEKPKGRRSFSPGDSVAPAVEEPIQRLLEIKLHDMGLTAFGAKTVLVLCKADSFAEIADSKAQQVYDAAKPALVERFNAGQNSKGDQILHPPIVEKPRNNSIEELERSAAELFGADDE